VRILPVLWNLRIDRSDAPPRIGAMQENSRTIRIRRGYDLPIAGVAGDNLERGVRVRRVAVLGTDFPGVRPSLVANEGDAVALGDPLFTDRKREDIRFCSPGTGRVSAIRRGRRRALLTMVIDLEDSATTRSVEVPRGDIDRLEPEVVRRTLLRYGLWCGFRSRPYGRIPDPDARPHAVFVTAIDTEPLAAEPAVIIAPAAESFRAGLRVLARLQDGPLYVCTSRRFDVELPRSAGLVHARFEGPHPAGLAGTHIHHLAPASEERPVWHIGYQDVMAIGRLFADGVLDMQRTVAVAGPAVARPGLVETRLGAELDPVVADRGLAADARVVSGSVLSGREWTPEQPFLGRYHRQISVLVEAIARSERRDEAGEGLSVISPFTRLVARRLRRLDTRRVGRAAGLVPFEVYERVFPFDLPVVPLLRALVASDAERAIELGALELDAEDFGLLSAVCPARYDYAAAWEVFAAGELRGAG
jgi:Na+-transporting NADH:ubiquinone oxidoreductase subunit A